VDPSRYPALWKVIESGVFDDMVGLNDDDFEFGLARILDGVAALITSRRRSRSR
jgi:hypothetical protein